MIETIILAAYEYEINLPPVKQKSKTGWWPIYDKDYPDEPIEHRGSQEAFEFLMKLPLSPHQRMILSAFCGTGCKVTEREAIKKYSKASDQEYRKILIDIEGCCPHTIKRIAQMFTA